MRIIAKVKLDGEEYDRILGTDGNNKGGLGLDMLTHIHWYRQTELETATNAFLKLITDSVKKTLKEETKKRSVTNAMHSRG